MSARDRQTRKTARTQSHRIQQVEQTEDDVRQDQQQDSLQRLLDHPANTPLTPNVVLQLQRTIGNAAVRRFVQQRSANAISPSITPIVRSQPAIQATRFPNKKTAVDWLVDIVKTLMPGIRQAAPETYNRDNLDTYLNDLEDKLFVYDKLKNILRVHGGGFYAQEDREGNIADFFKPDYQAAVMQGIRANELTTHYNEKTHPLSDAHKAHIFLGEVDNEDNPTAVTGYHWEGDGTSVAVAYGGVLAQEDRFGIYQKNVQARKNGVQKGNPSTFFPQDWTKAEIMEAIEYAATVANGVYEARTPTKARGVMIHRNNAGYYPAPPEDQLG